MCHRQWYLITVGLDTFLFRVYPVRQVYIVGMWTAGHCWSGTRLADRESAAYLWHLRSSMVGVPLGSVALRVLKRVIFTVPKYLSTCRATQVQRDKEQPSPYSSHRDFSGIAINSLEKAIAKVTLGVVGVAVSQDVITEVCTNRKLQAYTECYLNGRNRKQIKKRRGVWSWDWNAQTSAPSAASLSLGP